MTPKTKEVIAEMRKYFPKFSKVVLCYCRNPAYGCVLSEDAMRTLHNLFPDYKVAQNRSSCVKPDTRKTIPNRKKAHRLTLRLDDEAYAKFEEAVKQSETSQQKFLEKLLEEHYERE